jgi:hypothetical protein
MLSSPVPPAAGASAADSSVPFGEPHWPSGATSTGVFSSVAGAADVEVVEVGVAGSEVGPASSAESTLAPSASSPHAAASSTMLSKPPTSCTDREGRTFPILSQPASKDVAEPKGEP